MEKFRELEINSRKLNQSTDHTSETALEIQGARKNTEWEIPWGEWWGYSDTSPLLKALQGIPFAFTTMKNFLIDHTGILILMRKLTTKCAGIKYTMHF
eukprot:scaffold11813_cov61-Attheya_sp.AAC.1